jgi:predicted amidohydrolase YtcJ
VTAPAPGRRKRAAAEGAILGARVRTLDPDRPTASAVAWVDGTIIAVGDDAAVREHCDSRTEVIGAAGAAIVPGLVDGHFHPLLGIEWTQGGVDLMSCRTLDEAQALLAEDHRKRGDGWVLGYGLPYAVFPDGVVDGHLLADAVGDAPAYVSLYDGHAAVVTPRALELAGVTAPVALPGNSEVVWRAGRPTGELREGPAEDLVRAAMPALTDEARYRMIVEHFRDWNALGLTGVHAMDGTPETFALLDKLEERGDLTLRMVVPLSQRPEMSADQRQELLGMRDAHGRLWRAGAAKFFIDGTVEAGTAWLFEPDSKGECTRPYWPEPQEYADTVSLFARAGFQCITHAIGDRAVRAALDAYLVAGHAPGVRHRIEHIECVRDEELVRFAPEQVVASMQTVAMDMSYDGEAPTWPARLGPKRAARAWRCGELLRSGATLVLGSDWPIAWADPRRGIASAILRRTPGRPETPVVSPEQALTPLHALSGYTLACAEAVGEADRAGRIREGFRADFTGFAEDPVMVAPDALIDLPVTLTVVAGRAVHTGGGR